MKKVKKMLWAILAAMVCALIAFTVALGRIQPRTAFAEESGGHLDEQLHVQTMLTQPNGDEPAITVLTPGLRCLASVWSSNSEVTAENEANYKLQYNSASLISAMQQKSDVELYFAKCQNKDELKDFQLYHLDPYDYSTENKETARITDVTKHIVLLFESSIPDESNQKVYEQFEYVVDTVSLQYRDLTGDLPRLNLVGHSRGGLTNIQYATEHPYNVAAVYSMGAPYNGSVLGQLDPIMQMLTYKTEAIDDAGKPCYDESGNRIYKFTVSGAEDIMDEQKAIQLRDAWNQKPADADIQVYALGSMASVEYLKALVDEIAQDETFGRYIKNYADWIQLGLNFVEELPKETKLSLSLAGIALSVAEKFDYDIFKNLTDGKIDTEEVREIVKLYNVINGTGVIMDDLFIDINSQLGMGFKDGIEYNDFKRYSYIFNEKDITDNRVKKGPGLVHNLETMNGTWVSFISDTLEYGSSENAIQRLGDETKGNVLPNGNKVFSFVPEFSGKRTLTATGASITLYKENDGVLQVLGEYQNEFVYNYETGIEYRILIDCESATDYKFELYDWLMIGGNKSVTTVNNSYLCGLTVAESGFYVIIVSSELVSDVSIKNYNLIKNGSKVYSVYLEKGTSVIVGFKSLNDTSFNVEVEKSASMGLDNSYNIIPTNTTMTFTNRYSFAVSYELSVVWTSNTYKNNELFFVGDTTNAYSPIDVTTRASIGKSVYSFILQGNQTCSVIFTDIDLGLSAICTIAQNQLRWELDGKILQGTEATKPRGDSYQIRLCVYNLETAQYGYLSTEYVYKNQENEYSFRNEVLNIEPSATIGNHADIWSTSYGNFILRVNFTINANDVNFEVTTLEDIRFTWNSAVDINARFEIVDDWSNRTAFQINGEKGSIIITGLVSKKPGLSAISLKEIKSGQSDLMEFVGEKRIVINNLFGGGYGDQLSPYTIQCMRHFLNLRNDYGSIFIGNGYQDQICHTYSLEIDVDLTYLGSWTPLERPFSGRLLGNNHRITYSINIESGNIPYEHIGLFTTVRSGSYIQNLIFSNCSINIGNSKTKLKNDGVVSVGILTGSVYGAYLIDNIQVLNATIFCNATSARVGGIVGGLSSTLSNCVVSQGSFVTFSGSIGGMSGTGYISNFNNGRCENLEITKYAYKSGDLIGKVSGECGDSTGSVLVSNVTLKKNTNCIVEGTLITLADGRQVPVESLTGNESLLVWNLYTGTFDSAPILFIDKDASATYKVINLAFSDGTELKVISEHGLWDYNLNRYVYLDEDAAQYIGHWFNKQTTDGGVMTSSRVQLTGVTISMEETVAYSPVTYGHLCYYVNGMLSMPGGIDGLFNIFEVDAETMRYDATAMEADIAQYGLFTYEEFAQMLNVPREVYDAFNAQYFKVAIGKGIVTEERLAELAERYARQLGMD